MACSSLSIQTIAVSMFAEARTEPMLSQPLLETERGLKMQSNSQEEQGTNFHYQSMTKAGTKYLSLSYIGDLCSISIANGEQLLEISLPFSHLFDYVIHHLITEENNERLEPGFQRRQKQARKLVTLDVE